MAICLRNTLADLQLVVLTIPGGSLTTISSWILGLMDYKRKEVSAACIVTEHNTHLLFRLFEAVPRDF